MATPNALERLVWGQNVNTWSRLAHRATQWKYFTLPVCSRVEVTKARTVAIPSGPVQWPNWYIGLTTRPFSPDVVGPSGISTGTFMQQGLNQNRVLTYGGGYGKWEQTRTVIPLPASGEYYTRGWPTPSWDRHEVITAPDGTVHELIQFDPVAAPALPPIPNQALMWGRWLDGVCVQGKPCTATGYAHHMHLWTPWSHDDPHDLAIVLPDYVGCDGTLTTGPRAGGKLVLDRGSGSYQQMVALGGECRSLAEAAALYGLRIIDRSGFTNNDPTKPLQPHIQVQTGSSWAGSNVGKFTLLMTDLLEAEEA